MANENTTWLLVGKTNFYVGLSTEPKPRDVLDGSHAYEIDTQRTYKWTDNDWHLVTDAKANANERVEHLLSEALSELRKIRLGFELMHETTLADPGANGD